MDLYYTRSLGKCEETVYIILGYYLITNQSLREGSAAVITAGKLASQYKIQAFNKHYLLDWPVGLVASDPDCYRRTWA